MNYSFSKEEFMVFRMRLSEFQLSPCWTLSSSKTKYLTGSPEHCSWNLLMRSYFGLFFSLKKPLAFYCFLSDLGAVNASTLICKVVLLQQQVAVHVLGDGARAAPTTWAKPACLVKVTVIHVSLEGSYTGYIALLFFCYKHPSWKRWWERERWWSGIGGSHESHVDPHLHHVNSWGIPRLKDKGWSWPHARLNKKWKISNSLCYLTRQFDWETPRPIDSSLVHWPTVQCHLHKRWMTLGWCISDHGYIDSSVVI